MQLTIKNVRNIKEFSIDEGERKFLFYGENGSGKTTLLEGIMILNESKTFRASNLYELISEGEGYLSVQLIINKNTYSIWQSNDINKKYEIYVNGKRKNYKEIKTSLKVFSFQSKKLNNIIYDKYERARFFDQIFSEINSSYEKILKEYKSKKRLFSEIINNNIDFEQNNYKNLLSSIKILEDALVLKRENFIKEMSSEIFIFLKEHNVPILFDLDYNLYDKTTIKKQKKLASNEKLYDYIFLYKKRNSFLFASHKNK